MSFDLPGVALYPDDLSAVRSSLSARARACLRRGVGEPFILLAMDSQHARELLAGERARIEHALGELAPRDSEEVVDPFEAADVAADMFDEELGEDRAERLREELAAIERAERRLAEGTYGISVDSGQPIPDARLEAIPWAERTAEEQARYESPGG
jgi:RNA polymerase-binding transcription factor